MTDDKLVIPFKPETIDFPAAHAHFHNQSYENNRNALLRELRCVCEIPKTVSALNRDTVYKLVCTPEKGKLFTDSAGNIKGVFYKDGRIIEHARFKKVGPSFINAGKTVGGQVLLISIAMQLNRIEKGITGIKKELHNDRIAEIDSGVAQFKRALMSVNSNNNQPLIVSAIDTLTTGVEKSLKALKLQIEDLPDTNIGFWDNWFSNKSDDALKRMALAEESFQSCIIGIQTLTECYTSLGEFSSAGNTLEEYIMKIKSCGIETAAEKARLVPPVNGRYSEELWLSFINCEPELIDKIYRLRRDDFSCIEIEVKPEELVEV